MEMKRLIKICVAVPLLLVVVGSVTATPSDYYIFDQRGGTWADAIKSGNDTNMCWAAAASNILQWTGLGNVNVNGTTLTTADDIFGYFKSHWTDLGGEAENAWSWWFDGTNPSQGLPGYSQVVNDGGGFYPSLKFGNYYHEQSDPSQALSAIDQYLHDGYGTTFSIIEEEYEGGNLVITGPHTITCWGFQYDPDNPNYYTGIWVTDSDNSNYGLQYYGVQYMSDEWYLQGSYSNWFIDDVQALSVPEPATILLLGGLGALALFRNRKT
jgi:hypothetical protein